ncbi:MAG: hypothetical protein H8E38_07485 [SAR324 cluster bacterium]|nr:hypothetical protein [SAR324 cluster bacterium]
MRIVLTFFIFFLLITTPVLGQSIFLEQAESTVEILRENLVQAKAEALKDAKAQVIMQAVSRLLDNKTTITLKPVLDKYFLEQPDLFIESIRVISEGNTVDLAEFTIKIETQIFRSRILSTFRNIGLPAQKERIPIREIFLIYNADPALQQTSIISSVLEQLQERFTPYRLRIKVISTKGKILPLSAGLPARLAMLPPQTSLNIAGTSIALLELKLKISLPGDQLEQGMLKADLLFWPQITEFNEVSDSPAFATAVRPFSVWNPEVIIPEILDDLVLKWTPVIKDALAVFQRGGTEIIVKIKGLPGPKEEQVLFKTLFQNNHRWKNLNLDALSNTYVTYKGYFTDKQSNIFREFNLPQDAPFSILDVNWEDSYLVVQIQWNNNIEDLEPFLIPLEETGLSENILNEESSLSPELQVPLRTFKQTYNLPLARAVYDYIRHRGDSTLFRINTSGTSDSVERNKVISLTWQRLGVTHLRPKLTIYDNKMEQKKTYLLKNRKLFSFKHIIPEGEETFYLRISDEVGFLGGLAGSFQSFRYLLSAF